ncbi:MAG: YegS/Rv2252/BmrU family lipid kinase [Chloroflexi bacterium]|nr:YegS/Rv2252/BmrU family lipid kinase [Chloroflexota bacterium]
MAKLTVISNPAADHGYAARAFPKLRSLLEIAAEATGFETEWQPTQYPRHAIELAQKAAQSGVDVVVAVGGDGTVHEVVNGLMAVPQDQRPQLGVLPNGSGNDFATNLGLPRRVEKAVEAIMSGRTRPVDAAHIKDLSTGHMEYVSNTVGIGFSGEVNQRTKGMQLRGFLMYFIGVVRTIIRNPQPMQVEVSVDAQPPTDHLLSMISLCNGANEGGGFPVAPMALMDDGKLTYSLMRNMDRIQLTFFVPIVMTARQSRYPTFFKFGTGQRVRITCKTPMTIHMDGEMFAWSDDDVRDIEMQIYPHALRVLCGTNCP